MTLTNNYKIQKSKIDDSKYRYVLHYNMKGKKYDKYFVTKRDICLHLNCGYGTIDALIKKSYQLPRLVDLMKHIQIDVLKPYAKRVKKDGVVWGRPKRSDAKKRRN